MIQFTTAELNHIVARLYELEDAIAYRRPIASILNKVRGITDNLQDRIPINEQTSHR